MYNNYITNIYNVHVVQLKVYVHALYNVHCTYTVTAVQCKCISATTIYIIHMHIIIIHVCMYNFINYTIYIYKCIYLYTYIYVYINSQYSVLHVHCTVLF